MAEKKPKVGRPKMLPPEMTERFNIRSSAKELAAWNDRAVTLGYGSVAAWIRHVCNTAVKQPVR